MQNALKFPYNLLCDESNEKGDTTNLLTGHMNVREFIIMRHFYTVSITCVAAADIFHSIKDVELWF